MGPMRDYRGRILALAIATATLAPVAMAQVANGYRVEVFTTDQGLPSQAISDIAQTADGFLWIAAGGILARFDGYQFKSYTSANAPALVRRAVYLHVGIGDTLWIVDEGNAVLAHAAGRITEVVPPSRTILVAVIQDRSGALFGLGAASLWRLKPGSTERVEVTPRIPVYGPYAYRAKRDAGGRAWLVDSAFNVLELGGSPTIAGPPSRWPLIVSRTTGEVLSVRERGDFRDVVRPTGEVVTGYRRDAPFSHAVLLDRDRRLWVVGNDAYRVYERGLAQPVARIPQVDSGTAGTLIEDESGCVWAGQISLVKMCRVPFHSVPLDAPSRQFLVRGPGGTALTWDSAWRVIPVTRAGVGPPIAGNREDLKLARVYVDRRGVVWWSPRALPWAPAKTVGNWNVPVLPHRGAYVFAEDRRDDRVVWYAAPDYVYRVAL
jgi:hypothetical protein